MHDRDKSIITGGSEFDMIAIKAAIISFASCFSFLEFTEGSLDSS